MKRMILILCTFLALNTFAATKSTVWQIGENDNRGSEFALYPDNYEAFIANDFGWEDKYFLVGMSDPMNDWPYILPGPGDKWGGTGKNSGRRSSTLNILFGIENLPENHNTTLCIDLLAANSRKRPLFKVSINGKPYKVRIPGIRKGGRMDSAPGKNSEFMFKIPVPDDLLKEGGNTISLTILDGSWVKFDQVKLESTKKISLVRPHKAFLRDVRMADYNINHNGTHVPALLVDVEHLSGLPGLSVKVDGSLALSSELVSGRYILEVPVPLPSSRSIQYEILLDGTLLQTGSLVHDEKELITPAGYVDTHIGSAHSRWMIAPGPWMPFSMVKLSPDNQWYGWQAGYDPTIESIGTFSHIHEWTMAGLGTMPTNGKLKTRMGPEFKPGKGYRSRINKTTEITQLGYYKADLTDYNIKAELTATTRCSFQRYTFPKEKKGSRVLIDLFIPAEYPYLIMEAQLQKIDEYTIEGFSKQKSPFVWGRESTQEYTIYFVIEFDRPINDFKVKNLFRMRNREKLQRKRQWKFCGIASFDTGSENVVQMRTGLSFVSMQNARENLETEVKEPYGWDFDAVRQGNVKAWNELLNRIRISTDNRLEKVRFYTNLYRSFCSRNTFSDVNGEWVDAEERVRTMQDPSSPALGCDAFWNTFWNLNQLWNLVSPEWSNRWVNSQLAMYDASGWLAKGPAGMEYIPVMVAEHEIPLIVGAYQMGIRGFDVGKAYEAVKKMQTTPAQKIGGGLAGNRDLLTYLEHGYVPYDEGRFSNTMEYAYDDWTVAQFAKALGKNEDYATFTERGNSWRNAIDPEIGFARMKDANGQWYQDFDPYTSGANEQYVEGNAWQLTFFVPQDVPGLAKAIGKERFIERLDWGFTESYKTRFNGQNDQYWDYPVVQGNQQSMHFAWLFNWVGKPWLTQKWSRAVLERYYGYGAANAYLGDEDQGQMSAWFIMSAIGLFQTDGGCSVHPVYEIGSPLFSKTEINLGGLYGRGQRFTIEAKNTSRLNKYVQSATLNGEVLNDFKFPVSEVLKGGTLLLEMGPEPNTDWGMSSGTLQD